MRTPPPGLFPFRGFLDPVEKRYTQVPNEFWDVFPYLDDNEARVLWTLIRETYGYHRKEATLSLQTLQTKTGLNRPRLMRGLVGDPWTKNEQGERVPNEANITGCLTKGLVVKQTRTTQRGGKAANLYTIHFVDGMVIEPSISKPYPSNVLELSSTEPTLTTKKGEKEIEQENTPIGVPPKYTDPNGTLAKSVSDWYIRKHEELYGRGPGLTNFPAWIDQLKRRLKASGQRETMSALRAVLEETVDAKIIGMRGNPKAALSDAWFGFLVQRAAVHTEAQGQEITPYLRALEDE